MSKKFRSKVVLIRGCSTEKGTIPRQLFLNDIIKPRFFPVGLLLAAIMQRFQIPLKQLDTKTAGCLMRRLLTKRRNEQEVANARNAVKNVLNDVEFADSWLLLHWMKPCGASEWKLALKK